MEQTGMTAKVWLALLRDGTRCTVAEAVALVPGSEADELRSLMNAMALGGALRKYSAPEGKQGVTYGVTLSCSIPRGVTTGDVWDCKTPQEVG